MVSVARRLLLMIGGEAVQSGFHFGLNLALLRVLSAEDYGVFAIVMVMGGLSLTYVRSLTAMPASIWIGRSRTRYAASAFEVTFGSGAVVLALVTAIGVGLLLDVWLPTGAMEGGCFIGLWSLRSHMRTAFFALGRPRLVSLSDFAFTLSGTAFTAVALWAGGQLLETVFLALAAANGLGIALLLLGARRPCRVSLRRSVRRRYRALGRQLGWSVVSVTMGNLQGQGVALLVAGIAGPAAYAPIAAILVLFVPLRIAASAFVNMIQPEVAAQMARGEFAKIWRESKVWSALMGACSLVYGAAMILLLPYIRSRSLEDMPIYQIGFFAWAIYTVTMLYVMPRVVLEVQAAFKTVALVTAAAAVVGMAIIRISLEIAPPSWALGGGAASELIVLAACWILVRRRLLAMAKETHPGGGPAATARPADPALLMSLET